MNPESLSEAVRQVEIAELITRLEIQLGISSEEDS